MSTETVCIKFEQTHTRATVYEHFANNKKVKVVFTKKDGSERTMICSLHPDLLPESKTVSDDKGKTSVRPPSETNFSAFDLEKQAWRTFTMANIISIDGVGI